MSDVRSLVSRLLPALVLSGMLLSARAASAQSCTVGTSSVAFGSYDPFVSSPVDSTGQVDVACTDQTAYTVALDAGAYSGGSYSPRKMKHFTLTTWLSYLLYRDAARSELWGDGQSGTYTVSGVGAGLGQPNHHTVYGRLPAMQNVHVGQYGDTITVTVTY